MIGVQPGDLVRRHDRGFDQSEVDGREGDGLEAVHLALGSRDLALLDEDQVLDADAPRAGLVVAGLVGEQHARLQRGGADLGDALRAFVDRKVAADAVPGAVVEIEPRFPERLAGEAVELRAGDALGEHGAGDGDVPLQHARETVLHLGRRRAHGDGAGDVGGAVLVLRA